jgi:hypothetical protein
MVLPISSHAGHFSEKSTKKFDTSDVSVLNENENSEESWEVDSESVYADEDMDANENSNAKDFSQNQVLVTLSWSLMNQLKQLSRSEGIDVEHLLSELIAEGVTKRAFEDQTKAPPSHLMTRNGYVHNTNDGNAAFTQPQLSHHSMPNTRSNQPNRNKSSSGGNRNPQYTNGNRYQNRNYSNTNNGTGQQSGQFRQARAGFNPQQRNNRGNAAQGQKFNQDLDEANASSSPKNKKF